MAPQARALDRLTDGPERLNAEAVLRDVPGV